MIDPDGRSTSPIYDPDGNFLGTDDKGLQGMAVVMNKKDFTQGMSSEEANSKNLGQDAFTSNEALNKAYQHYSGLKNRPDYDGVVTIDEGVSWAKAHPNTKVSTNPSDALYLDSSKMDFGSLSSSDMTQGVKKNYNLFDYTDYTSNNSRYTTYALGNTQMKLLDAQKGTVQLYSDVYDWDYHDKSYQHSNTNPPSSKRDRLVWGDRILKGLNDSHGFKVYMYGTGTLKK